MLAYSSRTDVSKEDPYAQYLNRPIVIKNICTIHWQKNSGRFSDHSLTQEDTNYDEENIKSVKKYYPGDTITFYGAKKFYSMHVSDTYYLLGNTKLKNGDKIEFEYYYGNNMNHVWETTEEFIERKKIAK